jgi:pyridoxamine 5'-phosphate oxidase-like protein
MKIVAATSEIPSMTREEAEKFLESKLNLQIATIDEQGEPNIQPVWFYYDKNRERLLITTSKSAKKTQNLRNKPVVYFSIDDEIFDTRELKVCLSDVLYQKKSNVDVGDISKHKKEKFLIIIRFFRRIFWSERRYVV